MDELFIQYLWRFQKFDSSNLLLTDGRPLVVFNTGNQNEHAGPDFKEAKLKIDDLIWSGSVEIHYRSSDWNRHNHQNDKAYENVILHVVWIHDRDIAVGQQIIPTLELSQYVDDSLSNSYRQYINQPETILCSDNLKKMPSITISSMLDRALTSRLQQKSEFVLDQLSACNDDWEEVTYRVMAKNFGFKTNAETFERLAKSLPYRVLRKYHGKPTQAFALIFGMAGFLETPQDEYQERLKNEFDFLSKKHNLSPELMHHHWKYAKMRPANFPSVRLAQFASILTANHQLFSQLIVTESVKDIKSIIHKPLPEYWQKHFDFGKPSTRNQQIGTSSMENMIINSVVPVLSAYSIYLDEISYLEKAQQILEQLPTEKNSVTKKWMKAGIKTEHAGDSQALIYQYKELCIKKRCLNCNIGISILHNP